MELVEETPYRFRIPRSGDMRVPGVVFASARLLPAGGEEQALRQVANVATLPGIVSASYAMPDVHWGYGFPIGGVAATDVEAGGVVSPGGVGFDICCGVRLYAADLSRSELAAADLERLMDGLGHAVPRGMGAGAVWELSGRSELAAVLSGGSRYAVEHGRGVERDLLRCEDYGAVPADTSGVSDRAVVRGLAQLGSLGSGNHFLELQVVSTVFDASVGSTFGLREGQLCLMLHCGSRGLGHQICTDHVRRFESAMPRYGITVPDRQLACAPVRSSEGSSYLGAMAAASNFARANRQALGEAARGVFAKVLGRSLDLVYDIAHNQAKLERHVVSGVERTLCVHRKGATRALPPGHGDLPPDLAPVGQPVLIPGSMGTASYVLTGVEGGPAFASTCHGAGRLLGRNQAAKALRGKDVEAILTSLGVSVRGAGWRGLAEEMPEAYKDIDAVIEAAEGAGLARKVARLKPIGVVKG